MIAPFLESILPMPHRPLGRSGLQVSPVCLGGNVFGWTVDETVAFPLLDAWLDAGMNFIDTADTYSVWIPGHVGGESETILGKWMKARGNRSKVVLGTKVGMEMSPQRKGLSPKHIRQSIDDSLNRLQTDYVDLYWSHKDDPDVPLADVLGTYAELIKAGKVRAIGASQFTAARFKESLETSRKNGVPRYEALQPHYNLYERAPVENDFVPVCIAETIGIAPYYGLASGFLTGKYRSEKDFGQSPRGRGMGKYLNERGLKILAALDAVAGKHRANPAQVAIAWLIARPGITAPIASATTPAHIADLAAAASLTLDAEDMKRLNDASA